MSGQPAPSTGVVHPVEFVQALDRGLAVIRVFSDTRPRQTLSDVAKQTGMTRAAARRYLITLETLGYVGSDGRQFFLRPRTLELGYAYLSSLSIAEIAQDHLERLADTVHESCSASVLDRDDIVYIARASTNRIMTIRLSVGTRLPAYCTSMGRVMLASLPDAELDAYLSSAALPGRTQHTITDRTALRAEIMRVRGQGFAVLDQELEDGVRSVAVPVHDADGEVVAAVNTSAHAARVSLATLQKQILPQLRTCAEAIDANLQTRR